MGWVQGTQDLTLGGEAPSSDGDSHARHDPVAMMQPRPKPAPVMSGIGLDDIVAKAQRENLAFPVTVSPPGAPGLFDATGSMDWAVRSDAQNRPMRMTVTYDMGTGREASREGFRSEEHTSELQSLMRIS